MDKWIVTMFCTFNSPSQKNCTCSFVLLFRCATVFHAHCPILTVVASKTNHHHYQLRTDFSLREKQMNCLFYWCLLAVLSFVFLCLISRLQDLWGIGCWYTSFLCSDGSIVLLSKLWHFYLSEDSKSDRSLTACCFPGSI